MSQVMTASKWLAIRERFESSGLSQESFCRREGLSAASFSYWKRKFTGAGPTARLANPLTASPKFVEIDFESLAGPVFPKSDDSELVVELPLGVRLRFRLQTCA